MAQVSRSFWLLRYCPLTAAENPKTFLKMAMPPSSKPKGK